MVEPALLHTRLGPKGQAVIPKPVRDRMGLRPGDELDVRLEGNRIVLEKPDAKAVVESFLAAFPKSPEPARIDWEARYKDEFGW